MQPTHILPSAYLHALQSFQSIQQQPTCTVPFLQHNEISSCTFQVCALPPASLQDSNTVPAYIPTEPTPLPLPTAEQLNSAFIYAQQLCSAISPQLLTTKSPDSPTDPIPILSTTHSPYLFLHPSQKHWDPCTSTLQTTIHFRDPQTDQQLLDPVVLNSNAPSPLPHPLTNLLTSFLFSC